MRVRAVSCRQFERAKGVWAIDNHRRARVVRASSLRGDPIRLGSRTAWCPHSRCEVVFFPPREGITRLATSGCPPREDARESSERTPSTPRCWSTCLAILVRLYREEARFSSRTNAAILRRIPHPPYEDPRSASRSWRACTARRARTHREEARSSSRTSPAILGKIPHLPHEDCRPASRSQCACTARISAR